MSIELMTAEVETIIGQLHEFIEGNLNPTANLATLAYAFAFMLGAMVGTIDEPDLREHLRREVDKMLESGERYQLSRADVTEAERPPGVQ